MTRTRTAATPRLAPGVHVVPRDDDHVQVGLDPPARVLVRRRPDLLALLDDLVRGRPPTLATPEAVTILAGLRRAGLLVETDPPPAPRRDVTRTVALVGLGLGLDPLRTLLEGSGVRSATRGRPPDLYVLGSPRPVPRSRLDEWLGEGAPHLLLAGTGTPGSLRLGPLVEPGTTACQRCVDAEEAARDPRRTLVVEQLAALPARPLDPALVSLALAWAAREVVTYLDGRRPATWSGTIDLDPVVPLTRSWQRHPHCGCAWDVLPY